MTIKMKTLSILSSAGLAMAGSIRIHNGCEHDIYMWSVGDTVRPMVTIPSKNQMPPEPYYAKNDGGGPSLKISCSNKFDDSTPMTQLEYTIADKLWYDLSNINLGSSNKPPFVGQTLDLVTSVPTCPRVVCPAGDLVCSAAYNRPEDNTSTHACEKTADLFLYVCQPPEHANLSYQSLLEISNLAGQSQAKPSPTAQISPVATALPTTAAVSPVVAAPPAAAVSPVAAAPVVAAPPAAPVSPVAAAPVVAAPPAAAVSPVVAAPPAAAVPPAAKTSPCPESSPAAKGAHAHHGHKGIKHVHERIQRSRVFSRR